MGNEDRADFQSADLRGRNCVVTGATSGIGKTAAGGLALRGAKVILVGKNERVGHDTVRRFRKATPGSSVEFVRADLSRLADVRGLAARVRERCERVDFLINNASARFDDYHETRDGIEVTFANHLGDVTVTVEN